MRPQKNRGGTDVSNGSGVAVVGQEIKVTLGYKPSDVWVMFHKDDTHVIMFEYHKDFSTSRSIISFNNGGSAHLGFYPLPFTQASWRLKSIDNDGFTIVAPTQTNINEYGSSYIWSANK